MKRTLFVAMTILLLASFDDARATWPLPRPVIIHGVVGVEGKAISLDGRPILLTGPLVRAVETCDSLHLYLMGHVYDLLPADGRCPVSEGLLDVERLWLDEPTPDQGPLFYDGRLSLAGDGTCRIGNSTLDPVGGLAAALLASVGIDERLTVIARRDGSTGHLDVRSFGVVYHHATPASGTAPHVLALRALERYRARLFSSTRDAKVRVRKVARRLDGSRTRVVVETCATDAPCCPVGYTFDGHGNLTAEGPARRSP